MRTGVALFASAFELRTQTEENPAEYKKWEVVLDKVKALRDAATPETDDNTYKQLGALFAL